MKQRQLGIHPPPRHPAWGLSLRSRGSAPSKWLFTLEPQDRGPCPTPQPILERASPCPLPPALPSRVTSREQDRAQTLPSSDRPQWPVLETGVLPGTHQVQFRAYSSVQQALLPPPPRGLKGACAMSGLRRGFQGGCSSRQASETGVFLARIPADRPGWLRFAASRRGTSPSLPQDAQGLPPSPAPALDPCPSPIQVQPSQSGGWFLPGGRFSQVRHSRN